MNNFKSRTQQKWPLLSSGSQIGLAKKIVYWFEGASAVEENIFELI